MGELMIAYRKRTAGEEVRLLAEGTVAHFEKFLLAQEAVRQHGPRNVNVAVLANHPDA